MGVDVVRFRFPGTPPSREEVNQRLRDQAGEGISGYQPEGSELVVLTAINAFAVAYARKVLRDLGGVELDFDTREPMDEPLPEFVGKPWLEHDPATRQEIVRAWREEIDALDPTRRK